MENPPSAWICRCRSARRVAPGAAAPVLDAAARSGAAIRMVDDLCLAVARDDSPADDLFSENRPTAILACAARAVQALLAYAAERRGAPTPSMRVFDLARTPLADILAALGLPATGEAGTAIPSPGAETDADRDTHTDAVAEMEAEAAPPSPSRIAPGGAANPGWYPLIDRARCVSCGQCVQFCLFGVYQPGPDRSPRVANPLSCKNECPACARACPRGAILFPKSREPSVNGTEIPEPPADGGKQLLADRLAARRRPPRADLFKPDAP